MVNLPEQLPGKYAFVLKFPGLGSYALIRQH